jgi:hypothetical protein
MKSIIAAISLGLLCIACNKVTDRGADCDKDGQILIGKWKYTEQYSSNGGPGVWQPAKPAGQTIEFETNGEFYSAWSGLTEPDHFEILDSVKVKLYPASNSLGYVVMGYRLGENKKELTLYPILPGACIEGCSSKFVRK